jgi:uncharacterized OsmC-like protein
MKITLLSEQSVRLEDDGGPLTIEAESADRAYSPFHMLASGLALCTHAVLHSWATHAKLDADRLTIDVAWEYADKPHRVGSYAVTLRWPGLPENRREVALRAAKLCTVHATLEQPPAIAMEVAA